jgi:DNA repair protein RadC
MKLENSIEEKYMASEVELIYHSKVRPQDRPKIRNSRDTYKILLSHWNMDAIELLEEFKVLLLNKGSRVLGVYSLSKGGLSHTIVDPKLIFAAVLKAAACAIILAHNHPSGEVAPSAGDEALTKQLMAGAAYLDIKLLDHLIVTPERYYSFADQGLL